ncbi:hypothetical protein HSISS2_1149 [Streptococcus sp. HSISS2]|nr:hypothetical protein HSISS2_1149 [Streptococcus sp. HSISS2]
MSDEKAVIAMINVWTGDIELDSPDVTGFGNLVRDFRIFFV